MSGRRWWLALALVVALGVGLRIANAARAPDALGGDGATYHRLAVTLLQDGYLGYAPDHHRSWRPPLYPLWLAGVYSVTGPSPRAAKVVDSLLAGLLVALVALLGRRLGMPRAGLAGAALYALDLFEIRHAAAVYPEILAGVLLTLFVLLDAPAARPWRDGLRGLVAGLVLLVQPALATAALAGAAHLLLARGRPRRALRAALLLAGIVVALVPWTLRNHAVHDRWIYISTNGGFNLMKGYNPHARGGRQSPEAAAYVAREVAASPADGPEVELDRWFRRQALDWIEANPARAAALLPRRAAAWLLPSWPPPPWPVSQWIVLPLALVGAWVLVRRRTGGLVLATIVAGALPSILVVYAGPRYRTPVMGFLCLLAGVGAVAILDLVRRRRASSRGC